MFFYLFIAVMLVGSAAYCILFLFSFLVLSNLETRPTKTKGERQAESKQAEGMLLA